MPNFSPQQDVALRAVADWLKARPGQGGTPPLFRLFGYAGTGKTTLAKHIAEGAHGKVLFAAFTGKAALVMRRKGCAGASTIHSLIYKPLESETETPTFELWEEAPAAEAALIVIDECSMVDAELGRDLMSFGVPLLVLGDPAQLPPIQGGGFFTEAEPDAMLTEVHRQAQDDPIVRLSMDVRAGARLVPGEYGASQVVRRDALDPQRVLDAERSLLQEENNLVHLRSSGATNVISLYKALGGGWEMSVGQPFVNNATRTEMEKRTNWGNLLSTQPATDKKSPPPSETIFRSPPQARCASNIRRAGSAAPSTSSGTKAECARPPPRSWTKITKSCRPRA